MLKKSFYVSDDIWRICCFTSFSNQVKQMSSVVVSWITWLTKSNRNDLFTGGSRKVILLHDIPDCMLLFVLSKSFLTSAGSPARFSRTYSDRYSNL